MNKGIFMKIVARFSFHRGLEYIKKHYPHELQEVEAVIRVVRAENFRTKRSKEKTMKGKYLYAPKNLNKAFHHFFRQRGWSPIRIKMQTEIPEIAKTHTGFREMDMVKNELGVEVQFGKYSFMVYNVAAKMTIFRKAGIIAAGIEIVPMRSLSREMSTGVSYFEQIKSDLEHRGVSNIDTPVLILGIDV